MTNPFDNPFAGNDVDGDDPFGDPIRTSSFPKIPELWGKLIMVEPIKIESVPKPASFGGKPGETQERLTADVTVIELDGTGTEYPDMFISQTGIVRPAKMYLRDRKPMLGTVHFYPTRDSKDQFPDRESIENDPEMKRWLQLVQKNPKAKAPYGYAWGMEVATAQERAAAGQYWRAHRMPKAA